MNQTTYTITIRAEDCTSIVLRVLGLMQRRRLNFEQLEVNRKGGSNNMLLSMQVCCTSEVLNKVKKKIQQIIDVREVESAPVREILSVEVESMHLAAPRGKAVNAMSAQSVTMR